VGERIELSLCFDSSPLRLSSLAPFRPSQSKRERVRERGSERKIER